MKQALSTLPPDAATYGVMVVLVPPAGSTRSSRHSAVIQLRAKAARIFDQEVAAANDDPDVLEVRLCRYTVGRTQIIDEWTRPANVQVAA